MADLAQTLEDLKARFVPGAVEQSTSYYLSLGDAADEKWTVTITPSACTAAPGKPANADCVVKTSRDLFAKLVDGSWKPGFTDFMSGKIKTSDIEKLQRLQKAFRL
ncbi:MAG TPA: SCP2 sterol-binding domain-containing protein [Polyangia bacterium]